MQVAKADGLQNHSVRFVGSTPTWRANIMEKSHEIGIVPVLKTGRQVKLACGFESHLLRKEYLQQVNGKKTTRKLFISSKLK